MRIIYVRAALVYYRDSVLELRWRLVKYRQALPKYSEKISPDHTLLHATSAAAYQIKLTICSCVRYIIYIYIVLRCGGSLCAARSYTTCCFFLFLRFRAVWKKTNLAYIPRHRRRRRRTPVVPAEPKEINCWLIYVSRPHFCARVYCRVYRWRDGVKKKIK